jgi:hypothetical protein
MEMESNAVRAEKTETKSFASDDWMMVHFFLGVDWMMVHLFSQGWTR